MHNNQELLDFATGLARDAGKIITDYFYASDRADVSLKQDATEVTKADKMINQIVVDRVKAAFPEHGILGEEQSFESDRSELWVCDPIDGTSALIDGVPVAMFSLAFVVDGEPVVAATFDPVQNLLFSAIRGGGAFCNGSPIHVSAQETLENAKVALSGRYPQLVKQAAVYDALEEQHAKLILAPGAIFKSSLVARGRADGSIFPGRSAHDVAATALIVTEAGGKVTDLDGNEQRYDRKIRGAIVSNGKLHDALVEAVAAMGSENFLGF